MRASTITLLAGCVSLLSADQTTCQPPKTAPAEPTLSARVEVDAHEHCFTVRFFLKNNGESETEVVYGSGGSGLQVVPRFEIAGMTITPPTYLMPPRRSRRPDVKLIPAGKEVLYGTFTMGYPSFDREREEKLSAVIHFSELKATLRAEPRPLKIPAQPESK